MRIPHVHTAHMLQDPDKTIFIASFFSAPRLTSPLFLFLDATATCTRLQMRPRNSLRLVSRATPLLTSTSLTDRNY